MLERARAYNVDPGKSMFINTLRVFGSYISSEFDSIGDVNIELTYGRKDQKALSTCTRASGPDVARRPKPFLNLKKWSAFISITLEDISITFEDIARITDRFETIYSIDEDAQAVPPPADSSLGR